MKRTISIVLTLAMAAIVGCTAVIGVSAETTTNLGSYEVFSSDGKATFMDYSEDEVNVIIPYMVEGNPITAIAPDVANKAITFTIKIGDNTHTVPLGIDKYAKALINSDTQTAKAKNLTYAMVEYVRAMTGDSEFCNVTAPAGYDSFTLEGAASGNTPNLLTNIRFNLSGTIAIEVAGSEAAEGKAVNLVLATGRSEWGTIVDGSVVFTGLYVNEFFGNMTLKVYDVTGEGEDAVKKFIEDEEYTYSLANYLHGIIENGATDNEQAGVQALYNYAYYADAYVAATKPAAAN